MAMGGAYDPVSRRVLHGASSTSSAGRDVYGEAPVARREATSPSANPPPPHPSGLARRRPARRSGSAAGTLGLAAPPVPPVLAPLSDRQLDHHRVGHDPYNHPRHRGSGGYAAETTSSEGGSSVRSSGGSSSSSGGRSLGNGLGGSELLHGRLGGDRRHHDFDDAGDVLRSSSRDAVDPNAARFHSRGSRPRSPSIASRVQAPSTPPRGQSSPSAAVSSGGLMSPGLRLSRGSPSGGPERRSRGGAPAVARVRMFDEPRGLKGLTNLGNTCFMAACLQCLAHTPPLAGYFLDDPAYPERRGGKVPVVATALEKVMRALHRDGAGAGRVSGYRASPGGAHNPREFINALDRCPPLDLFTDRDQHDSQEFLRMLLDKLNDELNTVLRAPPYKEEKDDFSEPEWDKAERLWAQYKARTDSVMVDVFAGQLRSSVECHACGKASTSYDPFWDLSLPLRAAREHGGNGGSRGGGMGSLLRGIGGYMSSSAGSPSGGGTLSVMDCLRAFTEDDVLEGRDAFACPRCRAKGSATKRLRVRRWPRVLVLHLKRFQWGATGRPGRKIDACVEIPEEFSLGPFLTEDMAAVVGSGGVPKYRLFAVTNHMGSLMGGHYTATCDAGGGKWFTFNDASVDAAAGGAPPRSSSHAYVLLYALH